jgi:adenosylcobinamide kinase/adenosylcobinamide-phosphate guanylyltransferase
MKPGLIFVTGGTRSGKSQFALDFAHSLQGRKVFIATAEPLDKEMEERIAVHRKARPSGWDTVEEPRHLEKAVKDCAASYDILLIDCLTLWISNLLTKNLLKERDIYQEVEKLVASCRMENSTVVIVSNELGMGIVPVDSLTRLYRDVVGRANQVIASAADEVFLLVAGIPLKIKEKKNSGARSQKSEL